MDNKKKKKKKIKKRSFGPRAAKSPTVLSIIVALSYVVELTNRIICLIYKIRAQNAFTREAI
jgi:hypothetical protein